MASTLSSNDVTGLLGAWRAGDESAFERIIETVYPELRKIALRCLSAERRERSMQATELVNEAWIKLIDIQRVRWEDRAHFFAVAARVMRRILVDHARARLYAKRGGEFRRVHLEEALAVSSEGDPMTVQIDQALDELAEFDSRKAKVVEMRYFGGLTAAEIAVVLGVSPQSVTRDWNLAKAWLAREMTRGAELEGASWKRSAGRL